MEKPLQYAMRPTYNTVISDQGNWDKENPETWHPDETINRPKVMSKIWHTHRLGEQPVKIRGQSIKTLP